MHRIDSSTAEADKFGTGKDGFTEGDPGVTAATETTDDWFDGVQEEICNVVEKNNITLVKNSREQLYASILRMVTQLQLGYTIAETAAGGYTDVIRDFAYSPNVFVFVGDSAEIQTSDETAETWTNRAAPGGIGASDLNAVDYSSSLSLFCAVGHNGSIITSPAAGTPWTQRTQAGAYAGDFEGVCWSPAETLFCAVGTAGEIQTSPDGITWTARTAAGGYSGTFTSVAWDETIDLFCAVGSGGEIQTSPDGITWTARVAAGSYTDPFRGVCANNEVFCIVGDNAEVQTSPDGITWTARTAAGGLGAGDHFYAVSSGSEHGHTRTLILVGSWGGVSDQNGEFQVSTDNGVTWEQHELIDRPEKHLYAVFCGSDAFTHGRWLAGGESATLVRTMLTL